MTETRAKTYSTKSAAQFALRKKGLQLLPVEFMRTCDNRILPVLTTTLDEDAAYIRRELGFATEVVSARGETE